MSGKRVSKSLLVSGLLHLSKIKSMRSLTPFAFAYLLKLFVAGGISHVVTKGPGARRRGALQEVAAGGR